MNTVYLVKAFITKSCKEKAIIYNGVSAVEAFRIYNNYSSDGCVEVHIWENGVLFDVLEKNYLKEAYILENSYFGTSEVFVNKSEALKAFKEWVDNVYDSKEINDNEFVTEVTLYFIDNPKKTKTVIQNEVIKGEED